MYKIHYEALAVKTVCVIVAIKINEAEFRYIFVYRNLTWLNLRKIIYLMIMLGKLKIIWKKIAEFLLLVCTEINLNELKF